MKIDEIENILLGISEKSIDKDLAEASFTKLYHGYSKYLCSVVSAVLKNSGIYDEQILNTVVNNTFYKIYENPLIFSFPENTKDDKGFKAWLSKVAKNEFKLLLEEYYGNIVSLDKVSSEPAIGSNEIEEHIFVNINFKVLDEALNTLSERDKHILLTLYLYYEEGKNTPSKVLKMLCKMYDTTTANIRKIKERSEKKLIEYFTKHSQLKPLKHVK